MTPNNIGIRLLIFIVVSLLACSSINSYRHPQEIYQNIQGNAVDILRTDELTSLVSNIPPNKIKLHVVSVVLNNGYEERRAYLSFKENQFKYLGSLNKLSINTPIELVLFEINGNRFIVAWVDEEVSERPTFVTIERPIQLASDDSMRVLNTGEIHNRVALIYIHESQSLLWQKLTSIRVTGQNVTTGYALEKKFNPLLSIASDFIKVNIP